MGASIRVSWTGGPTVPQVDAVTDQFRRSDFDGLTDSRTYRPALAYRGQAVHTGADYVTGTRHYSGAFVTLVATRWAWRTSSRRHPPGYDGDLKLTAEVVDFDDTSFMHARTHGVSAVFRCALYNTSAC